MSEPKTQKSEPERKSPDAYRTISEVADALGLPQHVLRFWETRFPQIKPLKRAGGRRYYRPEDVAALGVIKERLYEQGYTIRGVQKLLRAGGVARLSEASGEAPLFEGAAGAPGVDAPKKQPFPSAGRPSSSMIADLKAALTELEEARRVLLQAAQRA